MGERALREAPQPQLRGLEKKMNRFLKGLRAAPWAWMQTGPLTVDVEARLSNHEPEPERIPASTHTPARTEGALLPERIAEETLAAVAAESKIIESAEPARPSEEAEPAVEETKLTLDDFPALKAAIESFEKRGDPIMITVDTERSGSEPVHTEGDLPERAPKRCRAKAKPTKHGGNRIAKGVILRPAVPRKQSQPKTQAEIDLSHHERHCTICHHPQRDAIEEAFCQWRNVKFIAREFNATGGPTAIYRHARALSLFKQRNLTLRSSLEFVIEQSERIIPTAEGLVKAIRAYTRINDAGEWIDTPTTHIVKVIAMHSQDAGSHTNAIPGLTLDVRKLPSCPDEGRVALTIESPAPQPLLPGSAPQVENVVTD
jgi:hypothetical protein